MNVISAQPRIQDETPPGYRQTEVGVIPEDWTTACLSAFAIIRRGASPRPIDSPIWYDKNSGVGWVRISDIAYSNGKYLEETRDYLSQKGVSCSRYLAPGSLVMSICATVGIPVITRIPSCIHDGFVAFSGLHGIDQGFLFYVLKSLESAFRCVGQTGSQNNLNTDLVRNRRIALPPPLEQRAIATALSDVDELIVVLDKLIAKKRAIKLGTMQQLLTGKTRLPGFSREWETRKLDDVFRFLNTASNPRSDLSEYGSVRYIHYGDIHTRTACFVDCESESLPLIDPGKVRTVPFLEDGDLVMVDASEDYEGISKSIEVRNATGRNVVAGLHTLLLRGNKAEVTDGFKAYLQFIPALKEGLTRVATGISVYGISKNNVKRIEVCLPDVGEQRAIAEVLSDMDAEIAALERRRDKTKAMKQGMMQVLLTGRKRLI